MAWIMFHKAILTPIEKYEKFLEWGSEDFNANAERFMTADFDRNNIKVINGILPDGERELHEVRFNSDFYTIESALSWLKARDLRPINFFLADRNQEDWFSDYELAENSALEGEFEIAKAGEYPQGNLTPDIFDEVVKNFKPGFHEPPITLGHVTKQHNDKPAMGWVSGLRRAGEMLLAKGKQIASSFDTSVREGRFKKRSIGLRIGPGGHYLHHLAFLGASGPACKGLKDIYDDNSDVDSQKSYEIESDINLNKGDPLMKTFTEEEHRNDVAKATREATEAADTRNVKDFDDRVAAEVKKAEDKKEADLKKDFKDQAEKDESGRTYRSDVDSRIKKLYDDKKLVPAQVGALKALAYSMEETEELTFAEVDPKDKTKTVDKKSTAIDLLFSVAENAAKVPDSKLADPDNADAKGGRTYKEEKARALEIQKDDKAINFTDAIKQARSEFAEKDIDDEEEGE